MLVNQELHHNMHRQIRILNRPFMANKWNPVRTIAQVNIKATDSHDDSQSQEWANARPAAEIPGPTKYELIRGFLPGGAFFNKSLIEFTLIGREMYGDIYRTPGVFGKKSMLVLFNPDDFPTVLRSEGIWPMRRGLETMTYHRKIHRAEAFEGVTGLLGANNEEWGKLRSAVNPVLMQPRNARLYISKMLEVNDEFLQRIREIRDPNTLEMPDSFEDEINRLTFESVAVIALNQQIGLLRKNRNNDEAKVLFGSLRDIFNLTLDLDIMPSPWKIIKTPKFHKIMKAYDTMYEIIMKYINQALEKIDNNPSAANDTEEKSVLEKLLKIDKKVAVVMALDMLFAGVDTTSTTMVGILLCIAKNPEKQEKLRQEIRSILPEKDSKLTVENMKNLPYLRACIKEGIRIYPITSGTMRSAGRDIVVSGYQVPKHQDIVLNSNLLLMEEQYYTNAKEFIPERWLRDEKNDQPAMNPFLYIPFGFGPRSCVGKRIVEMELEVTIARLVRNFNIEFNYPIDKAFKNHLINVPAIPLNFKFSEVVN